MCLGLRKDRKNTIENSLSSLKRRVGRCHDFIKMGFFLLFF